MVILSVSVTVNRNHRNHARQDLSLTVGALEGFGHACPKGAFPPVKHAHRVLHRKFVAHDEVRVRVRDQTARPLVRVEVETTPYKRHAGGGLERAHTNQLIMIDID